MEARFSYWVKVNISNYFVVVEGCEQRGHPSLSYCKKYSYYQIKRPPSDIYFIFNYDAPYVIC